MTRSLVVTTWFPDSQHPSRTPFCLAHVHALQDAGIDVRVLHIQLHSNASTTSELYKGVPVTRVSVSPTRPLSWLPAFTAVRRGLRTADVLHTMAFSSVLVAAAPWSLRRRPWIHTEHWNGVVDPDSVGGWWRRLAVLRHALRLPHVVTGVTKELADEMARFARPAATTVVPCVVRHPKDPAPFPPATPLRLVAVGLLIDRKNPFLALETIAWLREQGMDVRYEWIGDGPLLNSLLTRVESLGLKERVTFTGAVEPSRVQPMVETAHMFFLPSRQENFFTALAESLAVGRPGVIPRSGGFVDYCTPQNSEVVEGWDPQAFGDAIVRAWRRFGDADPRDIAATVSNQFSPASVASRFHDLYAEVATRHG